jgi:23S rRNA pseudouridine2605 synthase
LSAERLQKVLASAGIASRRDCEELISAGRVSVNGKVMHVPGARVDPENDEITVDGRPIGRISPRTYVMLHKPAGVISTADDPQGRPTVIEMIDLPVRLFPVGRLDYDSEGLLLLTDDGELAQRLTHPSYEVEKEYRALLDQTPTPDALREWRAGVPLDGVSTAPAWVDVLERDEDGAWVRVVLHEGRKRQIRAVAGQLGYQVLRLIRVREGPLSLGELPAGQWRQLADEEVEALWEHVGGRDAEPPHDDVGEPERSRARGDSAAAPQRRPRREQTAEGGTRRPSPGARRTREDRGPLDEAQAEGRDRPRADDRERPPIKRGDDRPRADDRPYENRPPRRDDRPPRDGERRDAGRGPYRDNRPPRPDDRPPRRDDRPPRYGERRDAGRGPYRDDRPPRRDAGRGPYRDDRPPRRDDRPPRPDDRPRQDSRRDAGRSPRRDDFRPPRRNDRPYENRGPYRDDRPRADDRPPRRDDRRDAGRGPRNDERRNDTSGPRREDERAAPRGEQPRERRPDARRGDDFAGRHAEGPEPGNEKRPVYDERQEKRGPGREWRARQAEEERERKQSTGPRGRPTPRWGARGGLSRRPGIFRPKPTTDDKDES